MTHNVYFSISQNTFDIGSKNSVYCEFIFVFELWFHFLFCVSGPKSSEKAGISRSSESSILSSAFSISSTSTSSDWAYIRSKNVQEFETCNYFNEISKRLSQVLLLLPMYLWRHNKNSRHVEIGDHKMGDQKMQYFFIKNSILAKIFWMNFEIFLNFANFCKFSFCFLHAHKKSIVLYITRFFAMTSQKHRQ